MMLKFRLMQFRRSLSRLRSRWSEKTNAEARCSGLRFTVMLMRQHAKKPLARCGMYYCVSRPFPRWRPLEPGTTRYPLSHLRKSSGFTSSLLTRWLRRCATTHSTSEAGSYVQCVATYHCAPEIRPIQRRILQTSHCAPILMVHASISGMSPRCVMVSLTSSS